MKRQLNQEKLRQFEDYLVCEERSNATIEKYLHDNRYGYTTYAFGNTVLR